MQDTELFQFIFTDPKLIHIDKLSSISMGVSYSGSGSAVIFGLSMDEFSQLAGLAFGAGGFLIALIGLLTSIYFRQQHLHLSRRQLDLVVLQRMADDKLREEGDKDGSS